MEEGDEGFRSGGGGPPPPKKPYHGQFKGIGGRGVSNQSGEMESRGGRCNVVLQ